MNILKRIDNSRGIITIILVCACIAAIIIGGNNYIDSLRNDLSEHAIGDVLHSTEQQCSAFDSFLSSDRVRLHSFAQYFAKTDSDDIEGLKEKLSAFAEIDSMYTIVNLDTGACLCSQFDEYYQVDDELLETYRALSGSGVRAPYKCLYSDDVMFGYYECFTFSDGVMGVIQKGYKGAKISEEFSLSFYNGRGLCYVVNQQGDILLRAVDTGAGGNFDNIFEMVKEAEGEHAGIESLVQDVNNKKMGTAILRGEDENYFYTYVPVQNAEDWYLISIVPYSAVTQEANEILMSSRSTMLIFVIVIAVFLIFFMIIWLSHRNIEEKNMEIEYQEKQFNIFSTYLASNTDDIYMMLDVAKGCAEYISPNVERVLGVSAADIMEDANKFGEAEYITGEGISFEKLKKMQPGDSREPMLTERINAKTGEHRWFRETVYCVSLQGENKIIVYISDRTKEQQTQDAMTQALDMAQIANKAKSDFLGSVSHDIRTPMNAIMGLTMLLQEEADDPERVLEYTHRIDAASQHLLGLINDVLDMNKIEGGNTTLNLSEINLPDIIEELNTIIRPQTRAKNQSFKIFASSFIHEQLIGDKLRINQILINILSNAVKYTQEGGEIEMYVNELPKIMKDYCRVQFIVKDNGQGMAPEYLDKIFDPFTREQNKSTERIQGTGLGMAITKSLIDLMGGTINVESELGKGSIFAVELELRIQEQEGDTEFWSKNGVERMIVADDEEEICLTVVKAMKKTGVQVDYATSGEKAIQMMREAREAGKPYDLILLDWVMPDLDGMETAKLIRKNYHPNIPIFFFTAYDWRDIEDEAREVGVNHFLPKPFFLYSFKKAITNVMGSREKKDSGRTASDSGSVVEGKNILVVDDVEVNRMILVKILNTLGATCEVAVNGQEAVDKFNGSEPGTFDIILMDVQMPVLDGHAATRAIRASEHPDAKSIAVIAMTANAFVDDVRDALASGMDAHVSKPIVLDQLKTTIQDVLSNKEQNI